MFDEHKDYAEDLVHYPGRVLQSGLVTLRDLKILGGIAIGAEIVLSALGGAAAFVAWLAAFLFSLLMLKEFFARDWLKRHFLVYAVSHLLVMPLLSLMVFSFATGRWPWEAPFWFLVYAWVGFFVTFNWEVSRKIRAPEDEIEGVDTYTRVFGTYGAAWVVLLIRVIDTALVALVGWHLGLTRLVLRGPGRPVPGLPCGVFRLPAPYQPENRQADGDLRGDLHHRLRRHPGGRDRSEVGCRSMTGKLQGIASLAGWVGLILFSGCSTLSRCYIGRDQLEKSQITYDLSGPAGSIFRVQGIYRQRFELSRLAIAYDGHLDDLDASYFQDFCIGVDNVAIGSSTGPRKRRGDFETG